ncbi:hypothetical protein [Xanthobacter sp. KR7-225]|uniref:hypothetical protein n=1 Tax=Xanthobacter sp. KR7-225 TaxID=3156613 RepID=UPI0032B3D521
MAEGRIPCAVPFCRRTADASKYEGPTKIICGKCWRLGSAAARRAYRIARRRERLLLARYERECTKAEATGVAIASKRARKWWLIRRHLARAIHDSWERVRIEATERKGGIA